MQVRLWGAPRGAAGPLGLTGSQLKRAVFFHDYQTAPQKQTLRKNAMASFFPPFLLSTHSFNECLLERKREKEKREYGMRCVWQGLGKMVSEVERQGRTEEGRGKS